MSNTSLTGTGGLALTLSGFKTADLTDPTGGHTFNIVGWTGAATLDGTAETLVDSVSGGVVLTNTSYAVYGLPVLTLGGFTIANLTDTTGGHNFAVSGWTGTGSVVDTGSAPDSITASKASNMTLTNSSLVAGTMSLGLSGITSANLTVTASSGNPVYVVDASAVHGDHRPVGDGDGRRRPLRRRGVRQRALHHQLRQQHLDRRRG